MFETDAWERLRHFRQALYDDLGLRQDSLFELLDAMLTSPQRSTLVRHSLSTVFRRRWPSTCDALSDGSIDTARVRGLLAGSLADSLVVEGCPVWVIDGTNWPRAAARASPAYGSEGPQVADRGQTVVLDRATEDDEFLAAGASDRCCTGIGLQATRPRPSANRVRRHRSRPADGLPEVRQDRGNW